MPSKNIKGKPCQNRKGKKCILFNGKWVYYTNPKDLAIKLRIPISDALQFIKDSGRRLVRNKDNEIEPINLKTENFRGILKDDFNIKKVDNKKVIETPTYLPTKKVDIIKEIGASSNVKLIVRINYVMNWGYFTPILSQDNEKLLSKIYYKFFDIPRDNNDKLPKSSQNDDSENDEPEYDEPDYEYLEVQRQYDEYERAEFDDDAYGYYNEELPGGYCSATILNDFDNAYKQYKSNINKDNLIVYLKSKNKKFKNGLTEEDYFDEFILPVYKDKLYISSGSDIGKLLHKDYIYEGPVSGLQKFIYNSAKQTMDSQPKGSVKYLHVQILSNKNKQLLEFTDGFIRHYTLPDVLNIEEFANIEQTYGNKHDTCMVDFINKKFPNLYLKIKKLETKEGIKYSDFKEFCQSNSLTINVYNQHGKIIDQIISKTSKSTLSIIIYNNHVYGINGLVPKKLTFKEVPIIVNSNNIMALKSLLIQKKTLPSSIKIGKSSNVKTTNIPINVISYIHDKIKYIDNPEYLRCKEIFTALGILDKLKDTTKLSHLIGILEKKLKTQDATSFFPYPEKFRTSQLLYKNDKIKSEKIYTEDKNKCYTYSLYKLPYLITFDYRTNKITKNPTEINDSNLYIARPHYFTILMPKTKLYPGYFLNECKNLGLEFDLLEELHCFMVPNYYRQIIDLCMQHLTPLELKQLFNIHIGMMEQASTKKVNYIYEGIYNESSIKMISAATAKLGKYQIAYNYEEIHTSPCNKLPVATQIKDMSRYTLYLRIKKLNLSDDNIIQISTDSITYNIPSKLKDYDMNDFFGWKQQKYTPLEGAGTKFEDETPNLSLLDIKNKNNKIRKLNKSYAGSGKTTEIVEKIIPELNQQNKTYIVLTPTYATLSDYKAKDINCDIIQRYTFNNQIPKEEYVIIDEIGFIGKECHDFIYKLNINNKNIICYGDFNQLQPVSEHHTYDQPHYINFLFNEVVENFTNYRNNFPKYYYDYLIYNASKRELIHEVNKYSSVKDNAEYILCYRIKTKKEYTKKVIANLGLKTWYSPGAKVMCITNKLLSIQSYNHIYNHKEFTVKELKKDTIIIKDKYNDEETEINKKIFMKSFTSAYVINIHQIQGLTLSSYKWLSTDNHFINNHEAYTIISRLRGNIYNSYDYPHLEKSRIMHQLIDKFNSNQNIINDYIEDINFSIKPLNNFLADEIVVQKVSKAELDDIFEDF